MNKKQPSEILWNFLPKDSALASRYIRIVWPKIDRIIQSDTMSLQEKIWKGMSGNKISWGIYVTWLAMLSSGDIGITLYGLILLIFSLPSASWFSIWTLSAYIRTLDHIEKHRGIDERFFKTFIRRDKDERYSWYCELQWMYLAAKALNQKHPWVLQQFFEMKAQFTQNKIPNF